LAKFSDEKFALALQGRMAICRYPFPGVEGGECGVRMLTELEMDTCRIDAQEYVKSKRVETLIDPEFLDRAISRFVVFKAFVDPDSKNTDFPEPFFGSLDVVKALDPAMVVQLFSLYNAHQFAVDPLTHLPQEEVDELISQLGKPGSKERLMTLDRDSLLRCAISLAHALRSK
jgi:hypothetical protein